MRKIEFQDVSISTSATRGGSGGGKVTNQDLTLTKYGDLKVNLIDVSLGVAMKLYQTVLKDARLDNLVHVGEDGVSLPIDVFNFRIVEDPRDSAAVTIDWVALSAGIGVVEGSEDVDPGHLHGDLMMHNIEVVGDILQDFF